MSEPKSVSLYYTEGTSDKEYHADLKPSDGGFVVNFRYGRRGSSLTTGTKTATPVEYAAALKIFDKLVLSKTSKGYIPGEAGTPYQYTDKDTANKVSGLLPQLLNVIDEAEARRMSADAGWCMQQKFDGRRMMLRKTGGTVEAINKLGGVVGVSASIVSAAQLIAEDFVIDGEVIGDTLHVFDILSMGGADLRGKAYSERYAALGSISGSAFTIVESWTDHAEKSERLTALKDSGAEGVVFKRLSAPYKVGRPNSGGDQLKYKFVETLSAVVSKVNAQRSVQVSLLEDGAWKPMGNVTIPPNHAVPTEGAVVEVRYLYAAPALVQPVYLGERDDVTPQECVTAQVKLRADLAAKPQDAITPGVAYLPSTGQVVKVGFRNGDPANVAVLKDGAWARSLSVGHPVADAALGAIRATPAAERKVPADVAAEFGKGSGTCLICARPLSDADAIAKGYGARCAASLA